jgi:hypothetical protein
MNLAHRLSGPDCGLFPVRFRLSADSRLTIETVAGDSTTAAGPPGWME